MGFTALTIKPISARELCDENVGREDVGFVHAESTSVNLEEVFAYGAVQVPGPRASDTDGESAFGVGIRNSDEPDVVVIEEDEDEDDDDDDDEAEDDEADSEAEDDDTESERA